LTETRWTRWVFPIRPSEWCALGRVPKSLRPPVFR
jgi:hypothetical protein